MFIVELTYRTRMGGLHAQMSTSQTVATRAEAEELRAILKSTPLLDGAAIMIKNALPPPTVDDAMQAFRKHMAEYPVAA